MTGVNPADVITIAVSATDIAFDAGATSGATATRGIVTLDGSETVLADGRTAAASLDAGWLAVTIRRARNGGFTNVLREVYIPIKGELTIWRTLNVERPDGTQGKIDCGNHHAVVLLMLNRLNPSASGREIAGPASRSLRATRMPRCADPPWRRSGTGIRIQGWPIGLLTACMLWPHMTGDKAPGATDP